MPDPSGAPAGNRTCLLPDDHAVAILKEFLDCPLNDTEAVFARFLTLPGAVILGSGRARVLYLEGSRPVEAGRCLLVAHADTVWDDTWSRRGDRWDGRTLLREQDGILRSAHPDRGLGADDRAGLAILWLLKNLGHSLMVTDLEEHGSLGSSHLRDHHPEVLDRIHREHAFAVQFDRRNGREFKCYRVGSAAFRAYVASQTGYTEPDRTSFTDICTLCKSRGDAERICGVNLSVGYHEEHSPREHLVIAEWLHTLRTARRWLSQAPLSRFTWG